jgi:hypothetical protein
MTDRVGTAMNLVQLASSKPTIDRTPPQPESNQLPSAHHPMLSLSELANYPIGAERRPFFISWMKKGGFAGHDADGCRPRRTGGVQRSILCHGKEAPARRYRLWL